MPLLESHGRPESSDAHIQLASKACVFVFRMYPESGHCTPPWQPLPVGSLQWPLNGPASGPPALEDLLRPNWSRTATLLCKPTSSHSPCWAPPSATFRSRGTAPPKPTPLHSSHTGLPDSPHKCHAPSGLRILSRVAWMFPSVGLTSSLPSAFTQKRPFQGGLLWPFSLKLQNPRNLQAPALLDFFLFQTWH